MVDMDNGVDGESPLGDHWRCANGIDKELLGFADSRGASHVLQQPSQRFRDFHSTIIRFL